MQTHPVSQWLLAMPRTVKRLLAVALDVFFCVFTVWMALCLRLERWVAWDMAYAPAVLVAAALSVPIFGFFGMYLAIFRHAGWNAMLSLIRAVTVYGVAYATVFTLVGVPGVPRTVGIIQPLLLFVLVGVSRVGVRFFLGDLYRRLLKTADLPGVLIYGAGSAGRQLASALRNAREQRVLGFLDDDERLHGHTVDGMRVFAPHKLAAVTEKNSVQYVLLAMPSLARQQRNAILLSLRQYAVHVRTLPAVSELASGPLSWKDLRELDIADILGRDAVLPNGILLNKNVRGKVVLVTGAGGSIGSELCRQVLKCAPACLLLVDMSEFALYQIHHELEGALASMPKSHQPQLVALLASVQNEERIDDIMATWRPHSVYHAAAYKHVPLVEHNPVEGIRNNVWGTLTCARAAARHGVHSFVLVSTDKAVRPTNVMGASKRLAELVVQALADRGLAAAAQLTNSAVKGAASRVFDRDDALNTTAPALQRTCFSIVRFGNVLGSSGSVVPLFRRQIESGGPITLTHADVTRYFMTIPEASELVIQAGAMASGGEVFVLDMGESVRIYDLACRMVELSGLRVRDALNPGGDIEIHITGMRPGEKLYEELLIGTNPQPTQLARVMKASETFLPWPALEKELAALDSALGQSDLMYVRAMLQRLAQYTPTGDMVDWLHMARAEAPRVSAQA